MSKLLARSIEALNLREETVSKDGETMTISVKPPPGSFVWTATQFLWGFAMIHYIFYGLIASIACVVFRDFLLRSPTAKAALALVIVLYLPSFFDGSEKRLGRPWGALRKHPIWSLTQGYFPCTLKRTKALPSHGKKYVFGWHPHGILILSRIHAYGGVWESLFPGIDFRVLGATPMFYVPGCREICLWMGAVDAGRRTAERVLRAGLSLVVYPGGSKEIFHTDPNSSATTVVLNARKGFVRLAASAGADLVPVFVFGEKKCYERLNVHANVRDWFLNTLKIPLIVFWGRYGTWYPFRAKQTVVFGAPISTLKKDGSKSTDADVDALHAEYRDALVALFEAHKEEAGYGPEETLVVV
jgi:hypothetical protein